MAEISDEARAVLEAASVMSSSDAETAGKLAEEVIELRRLLAHARSLVSRGYVRRKL